MNFTARMPPNHQFMLNALPMEPVSRTYQYRKIMKPMLERKRRARINKCLDELKDLMTGTLQAVCNDGENVSKLEKADILELTVRHLQRLREKNALYVRHTDTLNMEKFWAGFQHCAAEVAQFLNKYDQQISGDLIQHIASYAPNINTLPPAVTAAVAASVSASAVSSRLPSSAYLANSTRVVTANYQRLPYNELTPPPPPPRPPTVPAVAVLTPNGMGVEEMEVANSRYLATGSCVKREILEEHSGGAMWRPW